MGIAIYLEHESAAFGGLLESVDSVVAHLAEGKVDWSAARTALLSELRWLETKLAQHFGREEAQVFGPLGAKFPALATELGALHAEHRRVLKRLLELHDTGMDCRPQSFQERFPDLSACYRLFRGSFHEHARHEGEVLAVLESRLDRRDRRRFGMLLSS